MSQTETRRLDFCPLFNQGCDVGCSHKKKGNFESDNSLPEENCVSYFLVAVKEEFILAQGFRGIVHNGRGRMAGGTWSRMLGEHTSRQQRGNWKWGEALSP